MSALYLKRLLIGQMANYVYLIGSKTTREAWIVDPAWDIEAIRAAAAEDDMKITGALVTHYHPDHVGGDVFGFSVEGLSTLLEHGSLPIHVQRAERDGVAQVTGISKQDLVAHDAGDEVTIGDVTVKLLHTPGHTPGSQCFLVENQLVSGDTLFIGGCGRVDLPGGNVEELHRSFHDVLKRLPPETCVHPGHQYGDRESSTIGDELRSNPYFQVASLPEWLAMFGYRG